MQGFTNGMPAGAIEGAIWIKAEESHGNGGDCVELAGLPTGGVAVRNSRDPEGAALVFTRSEIRAFLGGAKQSEFDHLIA
ncbi:DUF397 domain-containing protein [Kitasatospora phosalacinea]|uniref:DUF397 domain-containing protein n=1 Tax=Kitasatospora phosalacinea TaxID=2065 RepID=A0A9W6PKM7_9ACTN|nr:DUF397 domain-containing protein [Kitasatospora phosalacinea]GLW56796.1 hypothetical protein Kpho01_48070 [Kitasatospora phosalacinea]